MVLGTSCVLSLIFVALKNWKSPSPSSHFLQLCFSLHLLLLLALELPPDGVADDLVPVDLRPGDWQLPPQGLEGGVRHGLVVLRDGALVVRLGALHQADKLLGQGLLRLE